MATLPANQMTVQAQQAPQQETVDINDFMLKLVQVLNKRFGAVNQQINAALAGVAKKSDIDALRDANSREKEELMARIVLLESEISAMKTSSKPIEPKVNKNILKHLE